MFIPGTQYPSCSSGHISNAKLLEGRHRAYKIKIVWPSRNICSSSDMPIACYHFIPRERFYGNLISLVTQNILRSLRKLPYISDGFLTKFGFC
jgi:hypothetical protein